MTTLPIMDLEQSVIKMLHTCYDPEIPVDIFELGLIYEVNANAENDVEIKMTLTSPMCPSAQALPLEVKEKVKLIPEVRNVDVEVVWTPTWDQNMMSDAAKLKLGFL
jgi:FeS assembly SUF system protein